MSITLHDVNGERVDSLTQWDYDITIKIIGVKIEPLPEVRYSNKNSVRSIRVDTTVVDNVVVSKIPNELLQECSPVDIQLVYQYGSGDSKTEYRFVIPVSPAKKPDGYVYTPTELKSLADLTTPLLLDANNASVYLEDHTFGDAALRAIKAGKEILVRTPNADGGNYTTIYSPVLMYQVPSFENKYLYLFFLRDEKQDLSSLLGLPDDSVRVPTYGQLKMLLSQEYNSDPLSNL